MKRRSISDQPRRREAEEQGRWETLPQQSSPYGSKLRLDRWSRVALLVLVCGAQSGALAAQTDRSDAPASAAPTSSSPDVGSGGNTTFRYHNPNAKSVSVAIEGTSSIAMTRNDAGDWTATATLSPEFYSYHFVVDGSGLNDPSNPIIRPNLLSPSTVVHVPAASPQPWDRTDIPHGELHHHLYRSRLANEDRDVYVYTPPGYDANRKQPYPVLYLLHGYSDDASGWTAAGQANLILDRLIADGKVQPMVVAMPLSYGTMDMIRAGWGVWNGGDDLIRRNQVEFSDQLTREVLPLVEAGYHVGHDAAHRAIAGLSMGGGESLYIGLNHPEIFGYVGAFSSAIVNNVNTDYAGRKNAPTRLLWLSCGTEDGLHAVNMQFGSWAKSNVGGKVIIGDTPGSHTWMVWRENLIAFTPLLFQER